MAAIILLSLIFLLKDREVGIKTGEMVKLESKAFANNGKIPEKYTCNGENISPPLRITEIPENAVSLVLIVDDPDAPGKTWVHWVIFNISPGVRNMDEGEIPIGSIQGVNDFGNNEYGGPCPPSGEHRYMFRLYALDTQLDLLDDVKKQDVERAMNGHVIDETTLVGLYSKQ